MFFAYIQQSLLHFAFTLIEWGGGNGLVQEVIRC